MLAATFQWNRQTEEQAVLPTCIHFIPSSMALLLVASPHPSPAFSHVPSFCERSKAPAFFLFDLVLFPRTSATFRYLCFGVMDA